MAECSEQEEEPWHGVKRPRGRAPKGKKWDSEEGKWVDDEKLFSVSNYDGAPSYPADAEAEKKRKLDRQIKSASERKRLAIDQRFFERACESTVPKVSDEISKSYISSLSQEMDKWMGPVDAEMAPEVLDAARRPCQAPCHPAGQHLPTVGLAFPGQQHPEVCHQPSRARTLVPCRLAFLIARWCAGDR